MTGRPAEDEVDERMLLTLSGKMISWQFFQVALWKWLGLPLATELVDYADTS